MKNLPFLKRLAVAILPLVLVAPLSAATVAVTFTNGFSATTNLTTEGSLDWVQLGYSGTGSSDTARNEKVGATSISTVTRQNARNASFNNNGYNLAWTDGTPLLTATGIKSSWEAKPDTTPGSMASMVFSVDNLATGDYTLKVYGTAFQVTPKLTASIGTTSNAFTAGSGQAGVYTVNFSLVTGEALNLSYNVDSVNAGATNDRNVGIGAITLAAVPEPGTALLSFFGIFGLIRRKR